MLDTSSTELHEIQRLRQEIAALKAIRDDYRDIVEHAVEMIFKLNTEGCFTFTSLEFMRSLGYTDGELIGQHYAYVVHPDYLNLCNDAFEMVLREGRTPDNFNFQVKHVNGSRRWVNCSVVCQFDDEGQPYRIIGFAHDITEMMRTHELLANETKRVAQAVVDAQEKERAEIGYELHDNVNQILSTARLYLELAKTEEVDRLELINRSAESIANAVSEIRKISRSLVPSSIGDLGLVASVEDLVDSIAITGRIKVKFKHEGPVEDLMSEKQKLMLFRIIQEQVTNVLKHSGATQLVIGLTVDKGFIKLSIRDNGKGFDKEAVKGKKGVGLHNIANRAELFNGTVDLTTAPEKGCKLVVRIPLK